MNDWYCAGYIAQKRTLAISQLERQGYEVFCPEFTQTVTHARKKVAQRKPLFPGYLFISLNEAAQRWSPINGTRGITQLIHNNGRPSAVNSSFMKTLIAATDPHNLVRFNDTLQPGDKVRAIGGALNHTIGTLSKLKDSERVVVLMSMLGREVSVTLPRAQLMKVS